MPGYFKPTAMRRLPTPLFAALVAGALGGALACASSGARSAAPTAQAAERAAPPPLAILAGQRVVVVPVQRLRELGTLGWAADAGPPRPFLGRIDDAIAAALAERGLGSTWVMPADVTRSARRNPNYATDPYALAVGALDPSRRPPPRDTPLAEPLASQLRTITALGDARYVLIPVELRFEPTTGEGRAGHAVLHVALVDARASQIRWTGEIAGDSASGFSPAVASSVAGRFADLFAPR